MNPSNNDYWVGICRKSRRGTATRRKSKQATSCESRGPRAATSRPAGATAPPPLLLAPVKGLDRDSIGRLFLIIPICRTFLGDFNPQKLPSRRL